MSTGQRIKEERKRLGIDQKTFGEIGGVSETTQGLYESGERFANTDYLQRIADEGADIVYILTGERTQQTDGTT